jgi:hypothetical protein
MNIRFLFIWPLKKTSFDFHSRFSIERMPDAFGAPKT